MMNKTPAGPYLVDERSMGQSLRPVPEVWLRNKKGIHLVSQERNPAIGNRLVQYFRTRPETTTTPTS